MPDLRVALLSFTRLFDADPITGTTQFFHATDDGEGFTIETVQDVTDLVEENKTNRNAAESGWKGDMHRIASIPLSIYNDLLQKGIIDHGDPKQTKFLKWLSDRDNQVFRVKDGRLI